MKKALLIEPCYENYGGYYRAFGMARGLALSGYDVTLLISSRKKFTLKIEKEVKSERLTIYKLPRMEMNPWVTGRFLRGLIGVWFFLRNRYDIIHLFTIVQIETLIPFLLLRICMRHRKTILDWDDYWSNVHTLVPAYMKPHIAPLRHYHWFCEHWIQRLANHATTTSTYLSEHLTRFGVKHHLKIINGVELSQFDKIERADARRHLGLDANARILLTVGNTFYKERTLYLLKFFQAMYEFDNSIVLYSTKDFRGVLTKCGYADEIRPEVWENIKVVGYLAGEKLANYMGACDAVVFMTAETSTEKACFPTRIGTFLIGERVIISNETDTETCRILKESGCAIIDDSLEKLAERGFEAIRDTTVRDRLEDRAREAKQAYSWESLASDLTNFYHEVLGDDG